MVQRRLVVRLAPVLLQFKVGEELVHPRQQGVANRQLHIAIGSHLRNHQVNTGLRLLLTRVEGGLRLLHHIDICDVLDLDVLRSLRHVRFDEVDRHRLGVLVVLNPSIVQEVEIHTERTNTGHLLRDGQRTIVCYVGAVEAIELVHLLLGNRVENSMAEQLVSLKTALGLRAVSVRKLLKVSRLHR